MESNVNEETAAVVAKVVEQDGFAIEGHELDYIRTKFQSKPQGSNASQQRTQSR